MLQQIEPGQAKLSGTLDMQTCAALVKPLSALTKMGDLQLCLSDVTLADSAALALLLEAYRSASLHKHTLTIVHWPAALLTLITLYSLSNFFAPMKEGQ